MPSTVTDRIDGLTTSVAVKAPCVVATTANVALAGLQTISSVTLANLDRVLVMAQDDAVENGIYIAHSTAWERAKDFDGNRDVVQGTLVPTYSSTDSETVYKVTTANPVVIGTSEIEFEESVFIGADANAVTFLQAGVGAVTRTSRAKMREVLSVFDFMSTTEIDDVQARTGLVNVQAAFESALTAAEGKRLVVPSGLYLLTITGDSDTLLVPSNCEILCEPGVIFKWGYWGSPLFAIVNKTNVRLNMNGAKFVWTGTFGTTTGSSDKFSYGLARPAYEWIAHIACVGSEFVTIEDVECAGSTTAKNINNFILMLGNADGSLTEGNTIRKVVANDVGGQVIAIEGQKNWRIEDIRGDRYDDASFALYGAGHVIYHTSNASTDPSENGIIDGVVDYGTMLGTYTPGSHTLSIKEANHLIVRNVLSLRDEGILNLEGLKRASFSNLRFYTDSTTDDTSGGAVYMIDSASLICEDISFDGIDLVFDAQRDTNCFAMAHSAGSENLRCSVSNMRIVRTCDGTESGPSILWRASFGAVTNFININKGSGAQRAIINCGNTSEDNVFHVRSIGAVANPRVVVSSGSRNTFYCSGDSTVDQDTNEFTPANDNAVIWESGRQYQSSKTIGTTTNPTTTFQLPKDGAYLVHISLLSSDFNLGLSGLYWVVWDDASVNDYTTAQLIGTEISKGGLSPTVLGLAVDNTGLCTLTSTAGSNTWILRYGYRQLSGR